MTFIPLEKVSELVKTINDMVANGVDTSELNEIRAQAKKLESIGMYVAAKRVNGMISALEWDFDGVNAEFNAAIRASGNSDEIVFSNYASALSNIGDYSSAIKAIDKAIELSPDNINLLNTAIEIHFDAFDTVGARNLLARLEKLGAHSKYQPKIDEIEHSMDKAGVTWEECADRILFASFQLSQQEGLLPRGRQIALDDDVMLYSFRIDSQSPENLAQAEYALINAIADVPYSPIDRFLYLSCEPA